jgi:hypothetical protein
VLRIDFVPAPIIHSTDVAGAVFLDRKTFQLRVTELTLVKSDEANARDDCRAGNPRGIQGSDSPVYRWSITCSSIVFRKDDPKAPAAEPATETHRTLSVRFLNGRP